MSQERSSTIRFANFLSPLLQDTYAYITSYVAQKTGYLTSLHVGNSLDEFALGQAEIGFLCGLLYVRLAEQPDSSVELLVAPVLQGERYQGLPIYFSDVVVRRESPFCSFDALADSVWAYNERTSHSGCNLVCYSLLERGKSPDYFGKTVQSGSHMASLQMVIDGKAGVTALDSHVLDVLLQTNRSVAAQIRSIDMLGPSSIPPLVVAKNMDHARKEELRTVLLHMHFDPLAAQELHKGRIERFVAVSDERYQDIRNMFARVQTTTFPFD